MIAGTGLRAVDKYYKNIVVVVVAAVELIPVLVVERR
jgi:hypothetical protein